MKHIILFTIVLVLSVFSASAKKQKVEKLEWNMTYEKFCKKFEPELKIDEELFSIVYLPKNSIFGNEYDEYLLFGKNLGLSYMEDLKKSKKTLIKRLQKTDLSVETVLSRINAFYSQKLNPLYNKPEFSPLENNSFSFFHSLNFQLNSTSSEYSLDKIMESRESFEESLDIFPSPYSAEVVILLLDIYDYAVTDNTGYYNYNDIGYLHSKVSDEDEIWKGVSLVKNNYLEISYAKNDFSYWLKKRDIYKTWCSQFINAFIENANKLRFTKMQNTYQKKAPFGSFFGMRTNQLFLIAAKDVDSTEATDLGTLTDKVDYKDFYSIFEYAGKTIIKKFVPKKSVDFVSEYYGVFDSKEKGLYQFVSVVNFSRTTDVKEMDEHDNKNKNAFNNAKAVLTEQYGQPHKKDEMSLYWITSDNVKIELFGESKVVKLWNFYYGKEVGGYDNYTCLVYTDLDVYNSLCAKEQEMRESEAQKAKKAQEEKENQQKSYF